MAIFLQTAVAICKKIENKEIEFNAIPYLDFETDYLISVVQFECDSWKDCTLNSQPDWLAYRPAEAPETTLFLKNKYSKNIYLLTV